MEHKWKESDSTPDAHTVIHHVSLNDEFACSTVHEVEEPLLGGVRSVMPDVATAVTTLLIEILFTVPGSVLHLWNAETLAVRKSHVLHVAELVMGESSSYESNKQLSDQLFTGRVQMRHQNS